MTAAVLLEVQRPNGTWATIGQASHPPGSFSSEEPEGRQVYIFGRVDGELGVWRSIGGFDIEEQRLREVHSAGLDEMSRLEQPYEMTFVQRSGNTVTARFRVVEEP